MEKKNHGLKITLVVLMCAIIVIGCAGLIFGALIKKPHEIFISFKDTNGAIFKEETLDEKEVKKENSTSENAVLDYAPTKDGYVFKGWFVDTELTHQFDKNDLVVGSLILYAKWEKQSFTVTFYDIDKQIILVNGQQNQVVFYDESAVAPETQALTHEGMTFSGWDNSFNNVKGDISITAVYTKNSYNLSFFSLGKSVASYPLAYQDSLITYANTATEALAIPAGKQFDCWCSDEALTQKIDLNTIKMPSSDMKLYAKFVFAPIENISLNAYCNNILFADTIKQFSNTLVFNGNDIILKANFSPIDGVKFVFNWYKIDNKIETLVKTTSTANETALSINLGVLSTGDYSYKFEVIAQENGYDSVANTASINFNLTAKGAPTITTPNTTFNYTGNNIAFSKNGADKSKLNFIGAEETDTIEFKSDLNGTYQSAFPTMKNAGSYNLYYRVKRANSASFEGNCTIIINKIALTLTPENISVTYGDEMPSFKFTCVGLVDGETAAVITTVVTYNCNYIKTTPLNATGETTYPIMINGEPEAENYIITCKEGKLTVNKKPLTITAEAKTITYGDSVPTYTAKYDGFVNGDTEANLDKNLTFACAYNINDSANNGVKTYIITPGGFTSTNYDLSFVSAYLTVNAKQITNLTLDITGNYTYNGTEQTPTYTLKNNAILLTINTDFTATLSNNKNAGTATLTLAGKGNYTGNIAQTFTIAKATLTITAEAKTITYGDPAPKYTATFSGFVNSETEAVLTGSINGNYTIGSGISSTSNVYTITPKFTSANYDLSFVGANLTVKQKAIDNTLVTLAIAGGNYTYNGKAQTPTPTVTCNDTNFTFTSNDYDITYSDNTNAGTATLTLTGKGNYTGSIEKTFTIAKAPLTVTANAETITYGDSAPKYTATFSGFVNSETEAVLTGSINGNYTIGSGISSISNVYTITPKFTSANYDLSFVGANLTVKQKAIDITLVTLTIVDGNYTYNGKEQKPTPTVTCNDTNFTFTSNDYDITYSDNTNAGTATLTLAGKGNYTGNIAQTFTIAKATLTITANTPTAITYGDPAPKYTATFSGFVNSETEAVLTGSINGNYTIGSGISSTSNVYTITPKFTSANYDLSFVGANLTVKQKAIDNTLVTLAIAGGNYTYNGKAQTPTPTVTCNDTNFTFTSNDYDITYSDNTNAGTATLTLTGKGNYSGSIEKTFTIAKAPLTITANAETITYGDSAPTYTAIYDGFVNGETVTALTGSITGNYTIGSGISSISNVYTITPNFTSVNYSITQKTATLTVNARNITIALTAQSGYTGAIWEKSLSNSDVSNVISGHSFSGTLQTTSANVNTYTCNPTDLTLTNFKWKSDYDIKDNNGNGISVKNNYNITYNLKVIIERGAINFSITDGSSVYDGAWHNSSITVDSPCAVGYSTDSATEKVYVADVPTFKNAGTHTVYYRVYGTTPGQYNESIGEITLKITPKALTVKANALTITYGDLAPTYTATFSGFVNGENEANLDKKLTFACDYNVNDSTNNSAKTYTITPSGLTSANYELSFVSANLTVNPKQINNLALDITGNYTYNGTAQTPTYTLKNNAILLTINTDYTAQLSNNTNAGTATLTLAGKGNYTSNIAQTFTIAKATLTITANTPTAITYGDPAPTTYTARFSGFVNGENENKPNILGGSLAITCAYNVNDSANNGAKTYEITPDGLNSANYTLKFVNGELVVKPQVITKETFTLTLTPTISKPIGASAFAKNLALATQNINSGEYIYTGLAQIPTYKLTKNDNKTELVGGKDFNFNISDNINVGSAKITIEGKGNYIGTIIDQIIIKAAELSITANAETITFGDSAPNYTASFSGFVNNETLAVLGGNLTFACDYNVSTNNNAKAYTITLSGFTSTNYKLFFVSATLTVMPKQINNLALDITGNYTYNGLEQTPTYTLKNNAILLTNNTDFTAQLRNNKDAGTATLTLAGTGNYSGSIEKTFTIAKAPLIVTANTPTAITYGDSAPNYTAIYDGFVNGETVTALTGSITGNYTIGSGISSISNVYTITPSFTSANYSITQNNATLTVNKKDLTINANNLSVVYNSDIPQYTLTFVGLYEGDKNTFNVPLSCAYKKDSIVGSYAITVGDISNNNYNITKTNGALTVTSKAVAVVWGNTAFSYNATVQTVNAHFVDVNGANVAVIVAITNTSGNAEFKNAGEYTASATTTNANYTLTNTNTQCKMAKGTYTSEQIPVVQTFNVIYAPTASLNDITLPNNDFRWETSGTIPTPNVTQYAAIYNADTANYDNATVKVTVNVAKATATINADTIQSFNYNGAPHSAVATLTYGGTPVSTTAATLLYSNGNPFTAANTYKTTISIKSDLYQATPFDVFVKICAVLFNGTFYTIEDAINTATSGTIVVKFDTTFATDAEIISKCYPNTPNIQDNPYYTIKAGVQLLVPYDEKATTDMTIINAVPTEIGSPFKTLTVPAGIKLVCNGTINVNAQRSHQSTMYMGHTAGNYGVLDLETGATLTLNANSTLNSNGYIIGGGSIVANSGATVFDVLAIKDFRGGTVTKKIQTQLFPFNQYSFNNIEATIKVNQDATYYARFALFAGIPFTGKYYGAEGKMMIIGKGAVFDLTSGYITKSFDSATGKIKLSLEGAMTTNSANISIVGVKMDTANVEFPIPGNFEFEIKSGSTFDVNNRFRFLPGAKLTVDSGATLNINSKGKVYFYGANEFQPNWSFGTYSGTQASGNSRVPYKYTHTDPATFMVNGAVIVNGGVLAGVIQTTPSTGSTATLNLTNATTLDKTNATITGTTIECVNNDTTTEVTFTAKGDTGAGNNVPLEKANYNAVNGKWIKQLATI